MTDEMKERLNLKTIYLKTTIDDENYLNCKKAVMELPSTCSSEYKQNTWEVEVKLGLSVSRMNNLPVHGKKCNNDYYYMANPVLFKSCAEIAFFSVRILQYGPFAWKRSNPCIFVLEQSR